jgi:Flp pilus assembly protein TadG
MKISRRPMAQDRSGSVAIEFALLSPIIIFVIISLFQLGINYMETSAVQTGAFLLARSIQSSSTPPTDAASAKNIVLGAKMLTQKSEDIIVSVSPLPTTKMKELPAQPTVDRFSLPGASSAVLIRVVANRTSLLPLNLIAPTFWSSLITTKIDYSVAAVTPDA